MNAQQAFEQVKQLKPDKKFAYIEEAVFWGAWEGKSYREMAHELGYEEGYLKDTGARLWRLLSECLDQDVTKKRIRLIFGEVSDLTAIASPPAQPQPQNLNLPKFPGSPLPFDSPLYVARPPLEALCLSNVQQPGSLTRLKAPWRMGKTSLINQVMGTAQQSGMKPVFVDIRQADPKALADLDQFLRWFCCAIGQQLGLTCDFETHWFASAGSKLSCTALVQSWLLHQVKVPLVLAIDTVHHLMDYPHIASHFFSMLRSWYEKARVRTEWQNLRLIMAYVDELDLPLQLHQSPFNVGLRLDLLPFTRTQVLDLASRDAFRPLELQESGQLETLFTLIDGQPYLWQLAFYWLRSGHLSLEQLLTQAPIHQGIYQEYLRYVGMKLQQNPTLVQAIQQLLTATEPIALASPTVERLQALGLIRLDETKATLACQLYRQYFTTYFADRRV